MRKKIVFPKDLPKSASFIDYLDDIGTKLKAEPKLKKPAAARTEEEQAKYADHAEWKAKKRAFDIFQAQGLEPHVADMWKSANEMKAGKREQIRKIVTEAVERLPNGKFRLCIQKPLFEDTCLSVATGFVRWGVL